MNKASKITTAVVILLVVAGGAFYGGMSYGKSLSSASGTTARTAFAGRTGRGGAAGAGFTTGTVIAKDSSSITLQLPNGAGSKIIFYSTATQISKTTSGTPDDLSNGTMVSVTGNANSDGSVTAQAIQIRPAGQNNPGQNIPAAPAQ